MWVWVWPQSEWFVLGLPCWGCTPGGTVSMYSTMTKCVQVIVYTSIIVKKVYTSTVLKIVAALAGVVSES